MKKTAIFLVFTLFIFIVGCDALTTKTTTASTTSTTTAATTSTAVSTTEEIDVTTTQNNLVDDVAYDDLFDDSNYKKFVIYFSEANFLKLIDDMINYKDEFGSYRDNTIQEVDITYYDGKGNVMEVNEVGFRTKGNVFTRVLPVILEGDEIVGYQQVSFQLEFNATFNYAYNSTEYNYLQSREVFDLDQLNFKHIRDYDHAAVTESYAYDLYREVGVFTSNTSYAIIYFNIEGTVVPYGLYLLQEPIDDVFVERYFGENEDASIGDLYKCTWQQYGAASLSADYDSRALGVSNYLDGFRRSYALKTNENSYDFSAFLDFIDLVNDTSVSNYSQNVATSLDIDAFARAFAMGFLIGSADDYRSNANNYYMYFNQGDAYYIPFDMDNSLGVGWNPYGNFGITLDVDSLQPSNYFGSADNFVLAYYLLQDPDFLDLYLGYLNDYTKASGAFSYTDFYTEYLLVKGLYQNEISEYSHLGLTEFSLDARYMRASEYFTDKIDNVREQLEELGYQ